MRKEVKGERNYIPPYMLTTSIGSVSIDPLVRKYEECTGEISKRLLSAAMLHTQGLRLIDVLCAVQTR